MSPTLMADNDMRDSFVASLGWMLDYYDQPHSAVSNLINGWQPSPIIKLHSETPFTVTTGTDFNLDGGTQRRFKEFQRTGSVQVMGDPEIESELSLHLHAG